MGPGGPSEAELTVSASDVESASPALLVAVTRHATSRPRSAATSSYGALATPPMAVPSRSHP